MDLYKLAMDKINDLGIEYEMVEHPPALTTEQADEFIEGVEGVRTKTMFLTDRKKREFYLLIMDDTKRMDMDLFKEIVGKKVKMASENSLMEKMGFQQELYLHLAF
ncbi:YbaK/EbsC family protein [Anaerococcus sp. Marseille-Q7828]|uniref:YbaK/EbsC family protein n=1 Tax=Anaerococcus sp. Marseille-Q7828 TaxID=3036300 RepID=UPI0024AE0336|nr:YbaK/EbsC family protein [Anaerococcus sp. Marseille-Q7828]